MRPQKPFPDNATERLEELLASSSSDSERSRIQSVHLRAKYGYGAERIAEITGLKVQTVRNIHSAYLKDGEESLKLSSKGGRKNFYLDIKEEITFLADFEREAESDGIKMSKIRAAYQKKVGKNIALTTAYRILHRHGWRRFAYRPGFWYPPQKSTAR